VSEWGAALVGLAFGGAVGVLQNAISGWVLRRGRAKVGTQTPPSADWSLVLVQSVLRLALSLMALYAAYRVSRADPVAVVATLLGLLGARYALLWRLSREE